jgi:hypothetical protein
MGKSSAAGVDNTARRTWDREEFAEKAEKREKEADEAEETAMDLKKRKRLERDPLHQVRRCVCACYCTCVLHRMSACCWIQ